MSQQKVFLTWKSKNEKTSVLTQNYFATRPELEYDVTAQYQDWKRQHPGGRDFRHFTLKDLPEFWPIIWERSEGCGVTKPKRFSSSFKLIGQLENVRLSAFMKSGIHLELDRWRPTWPTVAPSGHSNLLKRKV